MEAAGQRGLAAERGEKKVRKVLSILRDPDVDSGFVVHCSLSRSNANLL